MKLIRIFVNKKEYRWEAPPHLTLADALREHGFVSVKCGCLEGACGMCTVWLDGEPVLSCSLLLCRLAGRHVTTLEGLQEEAAVLAKYIVKEGGDQCGFCAPGFMMTVLAMKRELMPPITEEEIRSYLQGNLCRCSGYQSKIRGTQRYLADLGLADPIPGDPVLVHESLQMSGK